MENHFQSKIEEKRRGGNPFQGLERLPIWGNGYETLGSLREFLVEVLQDAFLCLVGVEVHYAPLW